MTNFIVVKIGRASHQIFVWSSPEGAYVQHESTKYTQKEATDRVAYLNERVAKKKTLCCALSDGFVCTLDRGHDGDHVAHVNATRTKEVARWNT